MTTGTGDGPFTMALTTLLRPKMLRTLVSLAREARRAGQPWDHLMDSGTITARQIVRAHPSRWGLPAESEVTGDRLVEDPALLAALAGRDAGDWRAVERLLTEVGADWERRAYCVKVLTEHDTPDDAAWLRAWLRARPESADAITARAYWLVHQAWVLRGSALAAQTTDEQFAGFHQVLEAAYERAEEATRLAPDDPTPWCLLVLVSRGLGVGREPFRRFWDNLVERAPAHRYGHDHALQYWRPHWSGSYPEMFDFAERAAASSPALSALPLRAALEADEGTEGAFRTAEVARAVDATTAWLDSGKAFPPHALTDRSLLALALVRAGRAEEAVEQFRVLGRQVDDVVWGRIEGRPRDGFLRTRATAYRQVRPTAR
ncbi:DUF4034 domain-containing protein [Actinosynnema sp. NPDC023587]|uniref:DUF4034 domain-containing protein n=1 Tax=Actinosynnema sp. NPDC023587 TaxID=3154695 RepID=UPI0033D8EB9E